MLEDSFTIRSLGRLGVYGKGKKKAKGHRDPRFHTFSDVHYVPAVVEMLDDIYFQQIRAGRGDSYLVFSDVLGVKTEQ